jgi:hypothetical protein
MTGPITVANSVEEIPVKNCVVAPQHDTFFAYYYLAFPVANGSHSRTIEVLLYRPGYQLVEIPPRPWWKTCGSNEPEKVAWKEAPDLQSQRAAVSRIAFRFERQAFNEDVLRFAAQEYARLAECPLAALPDAMTTRDELRRLAKECHQKAGEGP